MLICNFKNIKYASGWLESYITKFKSVSETLYQKREANKEMES